MRSGYVSICMEIGYSLGTHRGHAGTTAAHVRTYRGSAGGGDECVYIYAERERNKRHSKIFLLTELSSCKQVKNWQINFWSDSLTDKTMFYSTSLLHV